MEEKQKSQFSGKSFAIGVVAGLVVCIFLTVIGINIYARMSNEYLVIGGGGKEKVEDVELLDEKTVDKINEITKKMDLYYYEDYDEDEIIKYKKSSGDVDITISEDCKEKLWRLLEKYEDKKIGDFIYIGNNRNSEDALGDQINAIFRYENKNGVTNCQVDFEYAKYSKGRQSEWSSFSHSSSFEDAKERVKGVFHKQLLACIARSLSVNPNIVIATNASTPEKIRLKKDDGRVPATQSFSVVHGLGTKLTPMLKDGAPVYLDGKQVYKEIRADDYTTNLESIFKALFKKKGDIKDMRSFVGVCRLLKTQPKKFVKEVLENFVFSMFSVKAGRVDNNLETDYEVKDNAYKKFVEITGVKLEDYEDIRDNYYSVNKSKFK